MIQIQDKTEWVSFEEPGKILNYAVKYGLLAPIGILVDEVPSIVDDLMEGIDEMDATLKLIERAVTAYPQPALLLARAQIKLVLKIFHKIVDTFLGFRVGGEEVKIANVLTRKNKYGVYSAKTLPSELNAAFEWFNHPEKKSKTWGFVFFPYYLPGFDTDALFDTVDAIKNDAKKMCEKATESYVEHKAAFLDSVSDLEEALYSEDYYNKKHEATVAQARLNESVKKIIESYKKAVEGGTIPVDTTTLLVGNEERLLKLITERSKEGLQDTPTDTAGSTTTKYAEYNSRDRQLEIKIVPPPIGTITSIGIAGVNRITGETIYKALYRNPSYDILGILRFIGDILHTVSAFTDNEKETSIEVVKTLTQYSKLEKELNDDVLLNFFLNEFLELIAITSVASSDAWIKYVKENSEQGDKFYARTLSIDYSAIQASDFRSEEMPYNPSRFFVTLTEEDEKELFEEDWDYNVVVHSSDKKMFDIGRTIALGLASVEEKNKAVLDKLKDTSEVYPIIYDTNIKHHVVPVSKYNKEYDDNDKITRREGVKEWKGGGITSVTMEQLLGKNKKVMRSINKTIDTVDGIGEFAIKVIDEALDITQDVASITADVRKMIDRIMKQYIIDLLNRVKSILDLPAAGMVAGLVTGKPEEIPGLIYSKLSEIGINRYTYGGVLLVGGSSTLASIASVLNAIKDIEGGVKEIVESTQGLGGSYKALNNEMESAINNIREMHKRSSRRARITRNNEQKKSTEIQIDNTREYPVVVFEEGLTASIDALNRLSTEESRYVNISYINTKKVLY